eukprot:CAMPEP_0119083984 /NCGR_PEP_ID=MMETSP1178-20130426/127757_1 /TAXON_ID=33656 /ORGANISM="unid sp, Strain CCMP2000" /LENGTH=150 /DNA_ID=CAMNT_0007066911 /DNA_START=152 /DNA_END=601 /DNA_ORIENTATION=+
MPKVEPPPGLAVEDFAEAQAHRLANVAVLQVASYTILRCRPQQLRLLVWRHAWIRLTQGRGRLLLPLGPFDEAVPLALAPVELLPPTTARARIDGQPHGGRCGRTGHEVLLLRVLTLRVTGVAEKGVPPLAVNRRILRDALRTRNAHKML